MVIHLTKKKDRGIAWFPCLMKLVQFPLRQARVLRLDPRIENLHIVGIQPIHSIPAPSPFPHWCCKAALPWPPCPHCSLSMAASNWSPCRRWKRPKGELMEPPAGSYAKLQPQNSIPWILGKALLVSHCHRCRSPRAPPGLCRTWTKGWEKRTMCLGGASLLPNLGLRNLLDLKCSRIENVDQW